MNRALRWKIFRKQIPPKNLCIDSINLYNFNSSMKKCQSTSTDILKLKSVHDWLLNCYL